MSVDEPIYLRIRERSRWLGRLWLLADLGYYLGLVCAVSAFAMVIAIPAVGGLAGLLGHGEQFEWYWQLLPIGLVALPFGIALAVMSACLQTVAYRRSGIENDVRKEPGGDHV